MTALQQLYGEIEFLEKNSNTGLVSIIDLKRKISNYYLEKEKQQFIDAYKDGMNYITDDDGKEAELYYEQIIFKHIK
jgi:hypothetical protein